LDNKQARQQGISRAAAREPISWLINHITKWQDETGARSLMDIAWRQGIDE
jgi:hypothetical protein